MRTPGGSATVRKLLQTNGSITLSNGVQEVELIFFQEILIAANLAHTPHFSRSSFANDFQGVLTALRIGHGF